MQGCILLVYVSSSMPLLCLGDPFTLNTFMHVQGQSLALEELWRCFAIATKSSLAVVEMQY